MTWFIWSAVGLSVLVYVTISFFIVRMAMLYGHRGDLTLMATLGFLTVSAGLWIIILITLLSLPL